MDRDKIAARIRALLSKTVENGCTEDEAIAAAEKAAEMLARYNLTVDEVQMRASPFSRHTENHDDAVGERLWKVADPISALTGARYWQSPVGVRPIEINFFGFEHEVLVARYLLEICANAMRVQEERLRRENRLLVPRAQMRKVVPFLDGMSDRLYRRLKALVPPAPTGTGLVVLRNSLIDQALGLKFTSQRTRPSRRDDGYVDGLRAGDAVSLNRGLTGSQPAVGLLS